jgi:MFS family permease
MFPNHRSASSPLRIVGLMCLAESLSMTGFAVYPAFLALLRDAWGISNSEAGFIGGAFFGGYMIAVPILSSLTDRFDARRVYMLSCALSGVSAVGFAFFADGVVTAALLQALAGAGLAGTYMPGLKALTDRVAGPRQSRYIAFYTSTFGIGTSLSLLLAGWLGGILSWRWAFGLLAAGPAAAALLVISGLRPLPPPGADARRPALLRLDVVLRDRSVLGYILGYSVHCWELFGLRSWMVAFIIFSYGLQQSPQPLISATEAAAAVSALGLAASILGNEVAGRFGRARYIKVVMAVSGILAWVAGFSATWPCWLMLLMFMLYFMTVMADSAALTAGFVAATPPSQRGAAMAVYSFIGFGAGFIAPLFFGVVLDIAGGKANATAWGIAFGSLGLGCMAAPVLLRIKRQCRMPHKRL